MRGALFDRACEARHYVARAISAAHDFVAAPEVFVAPTLLRCYDIEKMQDWGGIGVDVNNITLTAGPLGLADNIVFPSYLVPIKRNPLGVGYMLNPTMPRVKKASGKSLSVSTVIDRLKVNSEIAGLHDAAKIKIENTIKYLKQCQAMQDAGW